MFVSPSVEPRARAHFNRTFGWRAEWTHWLGLDVPTSGSMRLESPVAWANKGWQRTLVTALLSHRRPPVLVVSMPRSGSSWVGDVLGNSPQAMYLREPLTQSFLDAQGRAGLSFRWFDESNIPDSYQTAVRSIDSAVPAFNSKIVRDIDQWRLPTRRSRRVVIKEVNPFALPWLIKELGPTVVYLLRHPAAVAASFEKLGWGAALEHRLPKHLVPPVGGSGWVDSVNLQAIALQTCLAALADHSDHQVVLYEDLCVDPVEEFRDLYQFVELTWTPASEMHVTRRSSAGEINDAPYTVSQPSGMMPYAWRDLVPVDEIGPMKAAWLSHGFPYYEGEAW